MNAVQLIRLKWSMRKDARERKPPVAEKPKMSMTPVWGGNAQKLCWRLFGTTDKNVAWRHYHPLTLQQKIVAVAKQAVREKWTDAACQKWYGMTGPNCAMGWTWIRQRAGSTVQKFAFVPFIVAEATKDELGLRLVAKPVPGDGVCYDWQGDHYADHVGTLLSKVGNIIHVAEFNTGTGHCTTRIRTTANVLCYVRSER